MCFHVKINFLKIRHYIQEISLRVNCIVMIVHKFSNCLSSMCLHLCNSRGHIFVSQSIIPKCSEKSFIVVCNNTSTVKLYGKLLSRFELCNFVTFIFPLFSPFVTFLFLEQLPYINKLKFNSEIDISKEQCWIYCYHQGQSPQEKTNHYH